MAGTIYIWLGTDDASWSVHSNEGWQAPQRGPLPEAAQAAVGARTVILTPSAHVLLTAAELPTQSRQRLRQAVPYAIEEQLSDELENLHFALGARIEAGRVPVAAVARAQMQSWVAACTEAGLHPHAMIPDVLAVPWTAGEWSLLLGGECALLRTGSHRGHALDYDGLALLLGLALEQAGDARPERLRVFAAEGNGNTEAVMTAAEAHGVATVVESCPDSELGLLARQIGWPPALDLLQGEFGRREHLGKLWRPWRPAAALLAVLLMVQIAIGVYEYTRLNSESTFLAQRIEEVYRQTFPEARNVVDPRVQMERHLATLRGGNGGNGLVSLLSKAGPVLARGGGLQISALRYKDGALDVELTLGELAALERMKQELSGKGLGVEIQSANARAGKVEARLALREGT